jgi:hypothetical protein
MGKLPSSETKKKISDTCIYNGVHRWNKGVKYKLFSEEEKKG